MRYDLVIAGGSIAGAALGFAASRAGARVLIVERTREFRDSVRGEGMHPWGVAEAQRLGLGDVLERAPALRAVHWDTHVAGMRVEHRELAATTPAGVPGINVHHPELQSALLTAAAAAGAEIERGARVVALQRGEVRVTIERIEPAGDTRTAAPAAAVREVYARLAVVADGRTSPLRGALGIAVHEELSPLRVAGVLVAGAAALEPGVEVYMPPNFGALALLFPLPGDRVRVYFAYHRELGFGNLAGAGDFPAFVAACGLVGMPRERLAAARPIGPLATFDTSYTTLDTIVTGGVAFIGDAAGNVDPAFGCGLSLALRDARCLAELLAEGGDFNQAAARYADERRGYYARLARIESWMRRILYARTDQPERSVETLMRMQAAGIDLVGAGPDAPCDDATEQAIFGAP